MRIIYKQTKFFKIFSLLFMSAIMAFTPFFTNLNENVINTVFASSVNYLNSELEEEKNFEVKESINLLHNKVYYKGTVEDDFTDDSVIIVLNEEETHKFKTYTPEDFSEIDCVSVKDLTSYTVDYVKEQIENKKAGIKNNKKVNKVNVDNFRRILSLELGEKSKENVIKAIKKLEKREEILSAGPNTKYTMCAVPDDTNYSSQWGLNKINAEAAWDITTGSNAITVGVLDSGIDASHPDLINRISSAGLHRDFTTDPVTVVETPTDINGHGTHVSGIIGAQGNNGIGVSGVAWHVRLVALKVGDSAPISESVILAINYAAAQNIPILNFSAAIEDSEDLYIAIAAYTGIFITSAGNRNKNIDVNPQYPATYDLPNIITVGASDSNDNKSSWTTYPWWDIFGWSPNFGTENAKSNYGVRSVDIFAPGSGILSTVPTSVNASGYKSMNGTSMAAPFVTGVAALIMSIRSDMDPIDIKRCILYSADTKTSLNNFCLTSGRLNAYKALQLAQEDHDWWEQPTWTSNSSSDGTITTSSNISNREPYGAFDSWIGSVSGGNSAGYPATQWTANGTYGWIELNLNEYIGISKIYFYNRESSASEYTKNAFFIGSGGVPLGDPFVGVNKDCGVSVIEVDNVVTNVIRLIISSSHGSSYVGASEIIIVATQADAPDPGWIQPVWTSNSNNDGIITASGYYGNEQPWRAYSGTMNGGPSQDKDLWSVNATSGFLQLRLNYYIQVHSIAFFNGVTTASHLTKNAKFTGSKGVSLGDSFTAPNHNFGHVFIPVDNVETNVIQLNISSSYGSYVGASLILINATAIAPENQPSSEAWTQPIWSGYTNNHGKVTASGYYSNELPWKAYNGTMLGGSGGNGDNWSQNSKTGWLTLTLDYPVYVTSIEIYGNSSGSNNRIKGAYFTGTEGVSLGSSFEFANVNQAYQNVYVGGVWTNIIRLNVTSSYGNYIGASMITIHAEV